MSVSLGFIAARSAPSSWALLLGAVHREFGEPGVGVKVGKGAGIALVSAGALLAILGIIKPKEALSWERKDIDARAGPRQNRQASAGRRFYGRLVRRLQRAGQEGPSRSRASVRSWGASWP